MRTWAKGMTQLSEKQRPGRDIGFGAPPHSWRAFSHPKFKLADRHRAEDYNARGKG